MISANAPSAGEPAGQHAELAAQRQGASATTAANSRGSALSVVCRAAPRRCPDAAAMAIDSREQQQAALHAGSRSTARSGTRERPQLLDPAERTSPSAASRHSSRCRRSRARRTRPRARANEMAEREPPIRRDLARERADADEHRHGRRRPRARGTRSLRRAAASPRAPANVASQRSAAADADRGERGADDRLAAADGQREHQLLPSGVLLRAQRAHRREQRPTRRRRATGSRRRASAA